MGWARLDDAYSDHPKILAAGPMAELLDVRAILYCARYETDGRIPRAALPRIATGISTPAARARKLVEVGRWAETPDGWEVLDFLEYHPTHAELEEQRVGKHDAKVRAGRAGGLASGRTRSKQTGSSDEANRKQNEAPSPTPISNSSLDSLTRTNPQPVDNRGSATCARCQGVGSYWHAGAGRQIDCECVRREAIA